MENLNELYQAIWAGGRTVHAPCVGDKGGVPRCRALCSSVPNPVLPGAEPFAPRCRRNAPFRRHLGWGMVGLPVGRIVNTAGLE